MEGGKSIQQQAESEDRQAALYRVQDQRSSGISTSQPRSEGEHERNADNEEEEGEEEKGADGQSSRCPVDHLWKLGRRRELVCGTGERTARSIEGGPGQSRRIDQGTDLRSRKDGIH